MTQHLLHVFLISHSNHIPQTVGRRILNNRKNSPSSWQGWKRCQSSQILHWINHFHFFFNCQIPFGLIFFVPFARQKLILFCAKIQISTINVVVRHFSYFLNTVTKNILPQILEFLIWFLAAFKTRSQYRWVKLNFSEQELEDPSIIM